jgi:hypothetical protein
MSYSLVLCVLNGLAVLIANTISGPVSSNGNDCTPMSRMSGTRGSGLSSDGSVTAHW